MARQYNSSNRIGKARGSYNKNWSFGGFTVSKKSNLTDKQFITEIYQTNFKSIHKLYEKELKLRLNGISKAKTARDIGYAKQSLENFKKKYPNEFEFFRSKVVGYKTNEKIGIVKAVKVAIEEVFGEEVERFRRNLIEGMKSNGIYNEFVNVIDESFNLSKITYDGDGTYSYITENGKKFVIDVTNSPITYSFSEVVSNNG